MSDRKSFQDAFSRLYAYFKGDLKSILDPRYLIDTKQPKTTKSGIAIGSIWKDSGNKQEILLEVSNKELSLFYSTELINRLYFKTDFKSSAHPTSHFFLSNQISEGSHRKNKVAMYELFEQVAVDCGVGSFFNPGDKIKLRITGGGGTASSTPAKDPIVQLLEDNLNIILQGAPGVGKTYITRKIAVSICEGLTEPAFNAKYPNRADLIKGYNTLVAAGRIGFITFHQSLDYEEFVEGLKPDINPSTGIGTGTFSVKPGLFKRICERAAADEAGNPYVLIVDEINRANLSKVLGELITLIEPSKRSGGDDPYSVTLPYSQEEFSVPSNLYILGTMNTADRSLGSIDYAIRRRFAFETIVSNYALVEDLPAKKYYDAIKKLIITAKDDDFETDDIMVGHSYFMGDFDNNLNNKILPLLLEYFRDGVLVYDNVTSGGSSIFSSKTGESKKAILKEYLDEQASRIR